MSSPEYEALRDKVDRFAARVGAREDLSCHAGCSACCRVELELCEVEAEALRMALRELPEPERAALRSRLEQTDACALLDESGQCSAYEARPLVCRTQGLALRYPAGTVPVEAVMASAAGGAEVTWCPLNFADGPPAPEEVLDAERVDVMLALINRRVARDPLRRTPLRALVREAVEIREPQPEADAR